MAVVPTTRWGPGSQLGHFRLLEVIGTGGMGVVFKAQDLKLGRTVALKVLAANLFENDRARGRFLREAQLASSITHPNVATIHEINEEGTTPFIAMELVPGENLKDLLREGPLPIGRLLAIAMQVCQALEAAHRIGVVHRDVKASNIMVTPEGQVKVLDFGLAKALAATPPEIDLDEDVTPFQSPSQLATFGALNRASSLDSTARGVALGTPSYMSPEQAAGQRLDARSDVFSLGIVMYEAATGELPFRGQNDREVLEAIRFVAPEPLHRLDRSLPVSLWRVVSRSLAKRPEDRYPSALALRDDLTRVEAELFPGRVGGGARQVAQRLASALFGTQRARARTLLASLALTLAALVVCLLWPTEVFPPGARRWIMVTAFENRTADRDFEGTIQEVLAAQLDQSPHFKVTPSERLNELLGSMGIRDRPRQVEARVIIEACRRGEVPVLVTGSIAQIDSHLLLTARLWEVASGESLATFQERATGKSEVLPAIDRLAASIRRRAGEALPTLKSLQTPAQLWTSSSWEALRLYSEASESHGRGDYETAMARLRQALELDPDFAMAHARLGRHLSTFRDQPAALSAFRRALSQPERLTSKERRLIQSLYYNVTENWEMALPEFQQLATVYALDPEIRTYLANAHWMLSEYATAAESYQRAIELSPASVANHYTRANIFLFMGDYQQAEAEIARGAGVNPQADILEFSRGYLALLRDDSQKAIEHFARMARSASPNLKSRGLYHLSMTYSLLGQPNEAESVLRERVSFARSRAQRNPEGESDLLLARLALNRRDAVQTRRLVNQALALPLDPHGVALAGELLARAGYPDDAERWLRRLEGERERYPMLDRLTQQLRGEIALARGRAAEAIDLLEASTQVTLRPAWSEPLARARLSAGQLESALGEYRKILANKAEVFMRRGHLWAAPLFGETLLRVAQILERQRKLDEAAQQYRSYLDLMKNADRDVADVRSAKAALAALERGRQK